ncbi:hypothetical protein L6452_30271 [Arctium lappa]|uniref:Uncharacterized protein n=1 Tax=Arctium lappa TaxID=4217 RepID=A0ACB8ZH45_ARCLA|nr:hypothetical protein L6452_30271 [Arctium lappa]
MKKPIESPPQHEPFTNNLSTMRTMGIPSDVFWLAALVQSVSELEFGQQNDIKAIAFYLRLLLFIDGLWRI